MLALAAISLAVGPSTAAAAGPADVDITTRPALYPDFRPDVRRYITRCTDDPVKVIVAARKRIKTRIDRNPSRRGEFRKKVSLEPGAAFRIRTSERGKRSSRSKYRIRCLPEDFPEWEFERNAAPDAKWLLTTYGGYVMILDRRGTPAWWFGSARNPVDAHLLPGDRLVWGYREPNPPRSYEIRTLDGERERELRTVGTPTDAHDIQELPNGNYLMMSYKRREGVDMSAFGGPTDGAVQDAELQELTPSGELVWSWNSKDHIALEETGRWWSMIEPAGDNGAYDIVHINSAEQVGGSIVLSTRHTDAIYSIDRASGEIEWKLGGTDTPESLTVLGDPHGGYPLGGQHDARLLGKTGSVLTAFDNAHALPRPPRGVRYRLDLTARTARLVDSVADPAVEDTFCCGSHRRAGDGGSVVSWGGTPMATGFDPDGSVRWRLEMLADPGNPLYRIVPLPDDSLGSRQLRRAMNGMQPHDGRVSARIAKAQLRRNGSTVVVKVRGREFLTASASGSLRIEGSRYPLGPDETKAKAGKTARLKLEPQAGATKIARLLGDGATARARIKLVLRDRRLNRRVEKLVVRAGGG